ncbi:alpha/beta hydrolase family protein [Frateuria hangzhouensis]|uniref:alpha/beta hydrolase family protein n=1 Tax=Frateuria hangzhouensis TaxID=2995589 RepID=UPI0022608559|nr:alpha/beta hydrolase [Frateuria sp. STR12]MCX7513092.1 alpha/beta hydrolase [Frateuria sp. STR12]
MGSQPFDFEGPRGYRLAGRMEQPEGPVRGWAILAHCFTCGKDNLAAARMARTLGVQGVGVLRFDFAGLGASGGSFADATFAADVEDLVAAGQAMQAIDKSPSLLVGHSLGGAAVLAAAGAMPDVCAMVTIGAPFDVAHVLRQIDPAALERIQTQGEAEVMLAGRPFRVRRSFVDDLGRHDQGACIASLHRPLLVMHAPGDTTVGIDNANRIFMAAKHPKSFLSLDDADHLLTRRADADYAATLISAWASRYLPEAPLA